MNSLVDEIASTYNCDPDVPLQLRALVRQYYHDVITAARAIGNDSPQPHHYRAALAMKRASTGRGQVVSAQQDGIQMFQTLSAHANDFDHHRNLSVRQEIEVALRYMYGEVSSLRPSIVGVPIAETDTDEQLPQIAAEL